MKRYRVATLGAGQRGKDHALAFAASPDRFELLGWCDRDMPRLHAAVKETGVRAPLFDDVEKMLTEIKPDIFCFATPLPIRLELVEVGVRHGVKAIAYEKPMASSLAEAQRICAVCDGAGVKQINCHQHKFGGHWQKVKAIIDSGAIGKIVSFHATSRGWYMHYITHLVDYVMYLNGFTNQARWMVGHASGRIRLGDVHASPDYVMGKVAFENGTWAFFECGSGSPSLPGSNSYWYDAGVKVIGTEGWAHAIVGHGWQAVTRDSKGLIGSSEVSFRQTEDTFPYMRLLADWLDDEKNVHPCCGPVTYHGFEIAMGILVSALEGSAVTPPVDATVPIFERLKNELPPSPSLEAIRT